MTHASASTGPSARATARRRIDAIDQQIAHLLANRRRHAIIAAGDRTGPDLDREREVVGAVRHRMRREGMADAYDVDAIWEEVFAATRGRRKAPPEAAEEARRAESAARTAAAARTLDAARAAAADAADRLGRLASRLEREGTDD